MQMFGHGKEAVAKLGLALALPSAPESSHDEHLVGGTSCPSI
jgi:hypothetical protein